MNSFEGLIEGKVGNQIDDELRGGARIQRIFDHTFTEDINAIPSISQLDVKDCIHMMRNHAGITVPCTLR